MDPPKPAKKSNLVAEDDEDFEMKSKTIQVVSGGYHAGNMAKISIDGEIIKCSPNLKHHHRGLHVVVISPAKEFKVEVAQVFDTHDNLQEFLKFIARVKISDGQIVVAACQDDVQKSLDKDIRAKDWFFDLGAKKLLGIKYRQSFAFIAQKLPGESEK